MRHTIALVFFLFLSLQAVAQSYNLSGTFTGVRPNDGSFFEGQTISGSWTAVITQAEIDDGIAAADGVTDFIYSLPLTSFSLEPNPIPPGSINYGISAANVEMAFRFCGTTICQIYIGGKVAPTDTARNFFGSEDLRVVYIPSGPALPFDQSSWGPSSLPINYKWSGFQWNTVNSVLTFQIAEPATSSRLTCVGFDQPALDALTIRRQRVIPLKAMLRDESGNVVGNSDLGTAPRIAAEFFPASTGGSSDLSDSVYGVGAARADREFVFSDGKWRFNLATRNYSSHGSYKVAMISGDETEYVIEPACMVEFNIQ